MKIIKEGNPTSDWYVYSCDCPNCKEIVTEYS